MKVLFISSAAKNGKPKPLIKAQGDSLQNLGVQIKYYTINGGIFNYFKHISKLKKYLKKQGFDILHAHYGLTAIVALLAKRKEKIIVSFMGDDIVGSNKINGSITFISKFLSKINLIFSKYFYHHSIVKSAEMLSKIQHSKVSLIPNGVNLENFNIIEKSEAKENLGISNDKRLIIFVSDPSRIEKNFSLAKKAVNRLKHSEVLFLPIYNKPFKDLVLYYNAADAMIMTSFHEGSPNVIKEAMACGCPIVSTNVGDVKWIFGETDGCYIADFNPNDVSEKLQKTLRFALISNKTNGRQRIIDLGIDSVSIAKKIIKEYKKVLQ